jgi:hypothetical protein
LKEERNEVEMKERESEEKIGQLKLVEMGMKEELRHHLMGFSKATRITNYFNI